ncbi:MAG: tetratricopeptide repeat protein [Candidatus Electryonea clarkiae]|nr:tetratricopeptide repeat protein [Candidatus Electryonea clarkiae]MDP8288421.1 tetratricopeptide repeat protein [Candidatus Electryonea clarkiae]
MEFNRTQQLVLICAAFLVLMLALFPPWCVQIGDDISFKGFYPVFGSYATSLSGVMYLQMIMILLIEITMFTYALVLATSTSTSKIIQSKRKADGLAISCPSCGEMFAEDSNVCRCGYELDLATASISPQSLSEKPVSQPDEVEETPAWIRNTGQPSAAQMKKSLKYSTAGKKRRNDLEGIDKKILDRVAEYRVDGNDISAEELINRTLTLRKASLGENHPIIANYYCHLADLERERENLDKAEDLYQKSLEILTPESGIGNKELIQPLEGYAKLLRLINRHVAAQAVEELVQDVRFANMETLPEKPVSEFGVTLPVWLMRTDTGLEVDLLEHSEISKN